MMCDKGLTSIWSSVEVDSWSSGFDYEEYLSLHRSSCLQQKPLSVEAYNLVISAIDFDFNKE